MNKSTLSFKSRLAFKGRLAILLSLIMLVAPSVKADDFSILVPDPLPQSPVLQISGARKAVRTSTDVIDLAMPVATLGAVLIMRDWEGLKQGAFTAATTAAATLILKYTVSKRRPDGSDWHSFPSGHTSVAFANAAFLQRRYGWAVGAPAYAVALYVGWGRTFAKKHDWCDVAVGAAIGAASAYIFTTPFARKHSLAIAPISNGSTHGFTASLSF